MKKLNFAILGCGRVSGIMLELFKKINIQNYLLFVIKKFKSQKLGNKFKVNFFQNYKDLIKEKNKIDVVSILTESGNHYKDVVKLAPHFKIFDY